MSCSAFHRRFKAATGMAPLQYQKTLRLYEARRLILTASTSASAAAFSVGYQSVSQFTREYRRMFGVSPMQGTRKGHSIDRSANA
nr:helix-turn-helix domain-containing protein [Sphingomonas faeni]